MRTTFLFPFLLFASSLLSAAQRIGPCPPSTPRSTQNVSELRGVVVDENLAVVPKVKVRLQVPEGKDFRDTSATETDPTGQFSFKAQPIEGSRWYLQVRPVSVARPFRSDIRRRDSRGFD